MPRPKKSAPTIHLPILGLTLVALISWVIPNFGLMQPFIVDDPIYIVKEFQSDDSQDASTPRGISSTISRTSNLSIADPLCPPLFDTPLEFPSEAVFRLKSVRLYPSIGPPHTFFLV